MPDTPTTIRMFEPEDQRNHSIFQLFARPIAFHRSLVTITGSINAALMLSQAIYWSQRTKNPDGWFYKTADEWEEETGMTRNEQEGARKKLRQFDWWQEELRKANGVPTLHYRINAPRFSAFVQSGLAKSDKPPGLAKSDKPLGLSKSDKPLTETTTETTNDTSYRPAIGGTDEIIAGIQTELFGEQKEDLPWECEDTEPVPVVNETFAEEMHRRLVEIQNSSNRVAALRELYVRLYGEATAPDYGYIGKVAKKVGGAGYLASRLVELVTRPPTGDILSYIMAEHHGRESRKNGYRAKNDTIGEISWAEAFAAQEEREKGKT